MLALFVARGSQGRSPRRYRSGASRCPGRNTNALQRVLPDDPWFEIYKVAPGVFAIYEPHQAEETIAYLIVGHKQAVLFDTGMGISDIHE